MSQCAKVTRIEESTSSAGVESPVLWAGPTGWLGQSRMGWGYPPVGPVAGVLTSSVGAASLPDQRGRRAVRGDGAGRNGMVTPTWKQTVAAHGAPPTFGWGKPQAARVAAMAHACPPWRAVQCPVLWAGLFALGRESQVLPPPPVFRAEGARHRSTIIPDLVLCARNASHLIRFQHVADAAGVPPSGGSRRAASASAGRTGRADTMATVSLRC